MSDAQINESFDAGREGVAENLLPSQRFHVPIKFVAATKETNIPAASSASGHHVSFFSSSSVTVPSDFAPIQAHNINLRPDDESEGDYHSIANDSQPDEDIFGWGFDPSS